MGYSVCPKCRRIMGRAFWEVFAACPDCGETWAIHPEGQAHAIERVVGWAVGSAILSFVPVLGAVFGVIGIFMGFVARQLGRRAVGLGCIIVAATVGVAGQSVVCWWGYHHYLQQKAGGAGTTTGPAGTQPSARGGAESVPGGRGSDGRSLTVAAQTRLSRNRGGAALTWDEHGHPRDDALTRRMLLGRERDRGTRVGRALREVMAEGQGEGGTRG